MIKRIICLANSRKVSGRCVAGREMPERRVLGPWIRPVSDRQDGEVSWRERHYQNGTDPRLLDIIDIPLLGPRTKPNQPENWLLDPRYYWSKTGEFRYEHLSNLTEATCTLWVNGSSTYNGLNDYVSADEANAASGSLKLIAVDDLRLRVYSPSGSFGDSKRRVQAIFSFNKDDYRLWVTDPEIEQTYLAQPDGVYDLGPHYLTVSLGEPWNGRCYKLVAAIIGNKA